jgi:hypothetical protein
VVVSAREIWLYYLKATSEALDIQNICRSIGPFSRYFLVIFNNLPIPTYTDIIHTLASIDREK